MNTEQKRPVGRPKSDAAQYRIGNSKSYIKPHKRGNAVESLVMNERGYKYRCPDCGIYYPYDQNHVCNG